MQAFEITSALQKPAGVDTAEHAHQAVDAILTVHTTGCPVTTGHLMHTERAHHD